MAMDRPARPVPSVREHVGDGVLELRVQGEHFVLEHAREVVRIVFEGPASLPRHVAIDLEPVRYINSSGISVLIRLNVERKLVVVGLADSAREILDLAGVLTFLTLVPSMEAARARLRGA
jgi:anti-anti-sigma factor